MSRYVMALDQGTTSSRAILFDRAGQPVAAAQEEFPQIFPQPGWVEHNPEDIWRTQVAVAQQAMAEAGATAADVAAIGITNQRETTVVWDRRTGKPVYNAIVWQCRRTADRCEALKASGFAETIRARTGLVTDAYFSGTKLAWILDNVTDARARAAAGELAFGTVDTFLLWRLSGGRIHVTDHSNASRTLLFNIHTLDWDEEILAELRIPRCLLPDVRPSSGLYGETDPDLFGAAIPLAGDAGDQQAATFGQACYAVGMAKNTYGTGCFMLLNTGEQAVPSARGLLTTIAWGLGGQVIYALEGSVFIAGAAVQWLRDELRIIANSADVEPLAASVPDHGGVYVVPAFVGLGAPYWDPYARGAILGLTRGSSRAHIARATLESIAYQTRDVLEAMRADSGIALNELRVDGGAVRNDLLMQFQADILGVPVLRPVVTETTALGAAYLAGLAVGFWQNQQEIANNWAVDRAFEPAMGVEQREELCAGWKKAVERARGWAEQ
ncbi:MAG: glycerol kinase GlpK [Chloroflexi bacterium]|nr:glycerol kinase GlpK [Chloroflexota bacterium]